MKNSNLIKKLFMGAVVSASLFTLAACGNGEESGADAAGKGASDDQVKISFYSSGSANVESFWETAIPMFEEEHPEIDVEFVFVPSGTGGQSTMDRIIAAKKAGKDSEIDIYEGGTSEITRSIDEGGLFYELTTDNIPNLANIAEENMAGTQSLAVPYRASAVLLAYNSEAVSDVPDTSKELMDWIKANPGRFAYNDPTTGGAGDSFVVTTVYNELDPEAMNSQDPAIMDEWDAGLNVLKEIGPYTYNEGVYPSKNQGTLDLLANGEVDMIPAWSDMALEQINNGLLPESTKLKQIDPAFTGGATNLFAVDNGDEERKEAAEKFLDFALTVPVQEVVINQMYGYPGIKWDLLSPEDQEKFADVSGGYRIFNGGDLGGELQKRWQSEVAAQ